MADRLSATVLLVEHLWDDRGKLSLLGVAPTALPAGKVHLSLVVIIGLQPPNQAMEHTITVDLHTRDDPDRYLDIAVVHLEGEPPTEAAVLPESVQVLAPLHWEVDLDPDTMHVIRVRHEDEVLTTTSFVTAQHRATVLDGEP